MAKTKFNPLLKYGFEKTDNTTDINSIIAALEAQNGIPYVKKGEFSADFDYTLIPIGNREETDLYMIIANGIKDIYFADTYNAGDLIYWKNNTWNLLVNTRSNFSTDPTTGYPLHLGLSLYRMISNYTYITGVSINIPAFSNLYYQIAITNTNNIINISTTSIAPQAYICDLIIENQKQITIQVTFAPTMFGANVVMLTSGTILKNEFCAFKLIKIYGTLFVVRALNDSVINTSLLNLANQIAQKESAENKSDDNDWITDSDNKYPTKRATKALFDSIVFGNPGIGVFNCGFFSTMTGLLGGTPHKLEIYSNEQDYSGAITVSANELTCSPGIYEVHLFASILNPSATNTNFELYLQEMTGLTAIVKAYNTTPSSSVKYISTSFVMIFTLTQQTNLAFFEYHAASTLQVTGSATKASGYLIKKIG